MSYCGSNESGRPASSVLFEVLKVVTRLEAEDNGVLAATVF